MELALIILFIAIAIAVLAPVLLYFGVLAVGLRFLHRASKDLERDENPRR